MKFYIVKLKVASPSLYTVVVLVNDQYAALLLYRRAGLEADVTDNKEPVLVG